MKIIILSNHRCGSTYFTKCMVRLSKTIYLGEVTSRNVQEGWLSLGPNKELITVHANKEGYRLLPWRKRKLNNHLVETMIHTKSSFTAKIMIEDTWNINPCLLKTLFDVSSLVIALKRNDIEDATMSHFFAMENSFTYDTDKHLQQMHYVLRTHEALHQFIRNNRNLLHDVREYENLDGKDVVKDFQQYFDYPVDTTINVPQKLRTKKEKIQSMNNYERFKKDFDNAIKEYAL